MTIVSYEKLMETAIQRLNTSKTIAGISNDFRFTCIHIRNVQNMYKGKQSVPENNSEKIIAALRKDMKEYSLLSYLGDGCDQLRILGEDSMNDVLNLIERILLSITEFKTSGAGDLSKLSEYLEDGFVFVDEQMEIISDRIRRYSSDNGEDDSLPHVKDHFLYTFENVYNPIASLCKGFLKVYPGIDKDTAHCLIEKLSSVVFCNDHEKSFKSDIREIRNSFSHGNYREIRGDYEVKIRGGNTMRISHEGLAGLDAIMFARSVFLPMAFPLLNLEVIRVCSGSSA